MSPIEISSFTAGLLKKSRWSLILRGIFLIIIGAVMFGDPNSFFRALTLIIGIILLIDGITMLGVSFSSGKSKATFSIAIIVLLIGLFAIFNPQGTNMIIACAVGLWIFFSALQDIYLGIMIKNGRSKLWMIPAVFMLFLGGMIFCAPWFGIELVGIWMGILLLISGGFTIATAISLWSYRPDVQ